MNNGGEDMSEILINEETVFDMVYKMIKTKANSNAFIQGICGITGFPSTLAIDGIVILTHYEPLLNDIRALYGRTPITIKDSAPIFNSMFKEIMVDLAVDKIMGNVPIAGVYFNAISAKNLTWRLGMLVVIASRRGNDFNKNILFDLIKLIRYITPQTNIFKFIKPDYEMFKKIVVSVSDNEPETFESKIRMALSAFE